MLKPANQRFAEAMFAEAKFTEAEFAELWMASGVCTSLCFDLAS